MNNTQLYIPKKCKVGFNLRPDTYTGKLGYIIYNDGKVWRKENSWESWREKVGQKYEKWDPKLRKSIKGVHGEEMTPIEFDNVPTEGFVLNKKAGGYSSGWNHRQTYSRVYDPRGWEFEITVPNLLYILQECSSFKGKGLEGQFVYSWDGKDLVLLPVSSPDYTACEDFTNMQSMKIGKKDLVLGHTYLTSKMEKLVYLGYFPVCENTYDNKTDIEFGYDEYKGNRPTRVRFENKHVFKVVLNVGPKEADDDEDDGYDISKDIRFEFLSSFSRLKKKVSDVVDPDYSNWVDAFLKSVYASKAHHVVVVPFKKKDIDRFYWNTKIFKFGKIETVQDLRDAEREVRQSEKEVGKFEIYDKRKTGGFTTSSFYGYNQPKPTPEEILTKEELKAKYGNLMRVYENGFTDESDL